MRYLLILAAFFLLSACAPEGEVGALVAGLDTSALARHEFGHVLDLPHSADPASIMFPVVPKGRGLTSDAVMAAQPHMEAICFDLSRLPSPMDAAVQIAAEDWNSALNRPAFSFAAHCANRVELASLPPGCGLDACMIWDGSSFRILFAPGRNWD